MVNPFISSPAKGHRGWFVGPQVLYSFVINDKSMLGTESAEDQDNWRYLQGTSISLAFQRFASQASLVMDHKKKVPSAPVLFSFIFHSPCRFTAIVSEIVSMCRHHRTLTQLQEYRRINVSPCLKDPPNIIHCILRQSRSRTQQSDVTSYQLVGDWGRGWWNIARQRLRGWTQILEFYGLSQISVLIRVTFSLKSSQV